MKGIIYTRVSSDEQIDGTSLASQAELCAKYCQQKAITVVATYREEGESAKDLSLNNRSQFLAALDYCRRSKDVDAFVVYRVDRFARNTEDHFAVRRLLMSYGTSLHSVTEPIGNKPAEKFIETVLAGAAEYDNAIRKQRCTDGMLARMRQGIWPFRAPKGYLCNHHRTKGEKKTKPDEPNPVLFPLIQRALRAYASGEIESQAALATQLNSWGFATAYGKSATPQMVDLMIGRHLAFYAGVVVNPWTTEEYPGGHEPMISNTERLQIMRRRLGAAPNAPAKRARSNPLFPLRRLLRCASCNSYLTACVSKGNGGRYGYYYCVNRCCATRSRMLRADELGRRFSEFLRHMRPTNLDPRRLESELRQVLGADADVAMRERLVREQRRESLVARRQRVFEMREEGAYDPAAFRDRVLAIDAELTTLDESSGGQTDLVRIDFVEVADVATALVLHLDVLWERLVSVSRSRFEKMFFPEGIHFDPNTGFRTTKLGLIYALLGLSINGKSREVDLSRFSSNQITEYLSDMSMLNGELKAQATPARKRLHDAATSPCPHV